MKKLQRRTVRGTPASISAYGEVKRGETLDDDDDDDDAGPSESGNLARCLTFSPHQ